MSKVAFYLQEHLIGEVNASTDARRYFSTDCSIFTLVPSLVVYPKSENDVRKTARFTWQLAERGRVIPMTARGSGTDTTGAALGQGIVIAFPAHMHRILELDEKSGTVVVEPGTNFGKLQQTLMTRGRYIPSFPASLEYSTIGGAVANNAAGEKSVKYGNTRNYVKSLRVVLSNGEVIETRRFSKRELNHKLGMTSFEGEIYRSIDTLLEESHSILEKMTVLNVTKNNAGYDLMDIKQRDGSIDLTPLFVGSQGTLGIVTEIALNTEIQNQGTTLFVGHFDDLHHLQAAVMEIKGLPDLPSAVEMVDGNLLNLVHKFNPNMLKNVIATPFPQAVLLVEFDNASDRALKKLSKRTKKIFEQYAVRFTMETDPQIQLQQWRIRQSASVMAAMNENNRRAIPFIEDGIVPLDHLTEYIEGIYKIFASNQLQVAIWGHAGDGNLHVEPMLNIAQVGDRQKVFRVMEEYYNLVISLGGSTTAEFNDGRVRAPYLSKLYGPDVYQLFQKVKQIFDPYNLLNPGVKINVSLDDIKPLLRQDYDLGHLHVNLPYS